MNIRPFAIIFVCLAAPAIAFPLGIRVGSGWAVKSGPQLLQRQDGKLISAHAESARVIVPTPPDTHPTLDEKAQTPASSSILSPIYPTSAPAETPAPQGFQSATRQSDGEPAAASPEGASDPTILSSPSTQEGPEAHGESSNFRTRHGGLAFAHDSSRRYSRHRRHYHYFAHRFGRQTNPFSAFAGLFFH